jgi:hypothetical protein
MSDVSFSGSIPTIQRGVFEVTDTSATKAAAEKVQQKTESIAEDERLGRNIDVKA